MAGLSKDGIMRALAELSSALPASTLPRELFLVGGAALVLLYDARESTKDVDVVSADASIRAAALSVATRLGLPADWLNDGAKGYIQGLVPGAIVFSSSVLTVRALAPQQLLAMKLSAWRDDIDIEDSRLLLAHLIGARDDVWRLVEPHLVPGRELKARYAFDDLWEAEHGRA